MILSTLTLTYQARRKCGAWGASAPPPQFLAKQLTLFQPEGQIMHTTVIQAPPEFQTLQRPCLLPMNMKNF